jgi:hypothetical protein
MLRLVLSALALAAFLPLSANSANINGFAFDVLDPTPRELRLDNDVDGGAMPGRMGQRFNFALNGDSWVSPDGLVGAGRALTFAAGTIAGSSGSVFDPTPLAPNSGDEYWANAGALTVFGLNCDASGGGGNARLASGFGPDGCLLSNYAGGVGDPNLPAIVAGGGDPFVALGMNGFDGLPYDPNTPLDNDIRLSLASAGALPGVGANGPQFGAAGNPFRLEYLGPNSILSGSAGSFAEAFIPRFHDDWANLAKDINPDPNQSWAIGNLLPSPTFATNNIWNFSKSSSFNGASWTSDGSTGRVTIHERTVRDLLNLGSLGGFFLNGDTDGVVIDPNTGLDLSSEYPFVGSVGVPASLKIPTDNFGVTDPNFLLAYDPVTFNIADPNTYPADPKTRACLLANPNGGGSGALPLRMMPLAGIGCVDTNSGVTIPILNGTNLQQGFKPWTDWVIEIDVRAPGVNPNFGHATLTGTGSIYSQAVGGTVVNFNMLASTQNGPWLSDTNGVDGDPNTPDGFGRDIPTTPGQVTNCQNNGDCQPGTQPGANFLAFTDVNYFCSVENSTLGANDPTTLNFGGAAVQADGSDGYVLFSSEAPASLALAPCHALQTIPYDVATGVLRMVGPNFVGTLALGSDNFQTVGLREVPEPGTGLLLGLGLAGLAYMRRRST